MLTVITIYVKVKLRKRNEGGDILYNDERFAQLVKERGVKWVAVAKYLGISTVTLYRKRKGVSEYTRSEIQKCCEFFGLKNMDYIFYAQELRKRN